MLDGSWLNGAAPRAYLARLAAEHPVIEVRAGERTAWLVTGHEEAKSVLAAPEMGRAGLNGLDPAAHGLPEALALVRGMANTDGPEHLRMRRLFVGAFTRQRMAGLHEGVDALVGDLLDDLETAGPPADLARHFSEPLSSRVLALLLGLTGDDAVRFAAWLDETGRAFRTGDAATGMDRLQRLHGLIGEGLERRRHTPGEDLLGDLAAASRGDGSPDDAELTDIAVQVVMAGVEPTAMQIGLAVTGLWNEFDDPVRLLSDPRQSERTIEEVLRRHHTSLGVGGLLRVAETDVVVGDAVVPAGGLVLVCTQGAAVDERAVPTPLDADPDRASVHHLAFGHGAHRCIGAALARLVVGTALRGLFGRFPELRPAVPLEELPRGGGLLFVGFEEIPITW